MSKFHINSKGEAGECRAEQGGCPFGGADEHYTTAEAAREAYEKAMGTKKTLFGLGGASRKRKAAKQAPLAAPAPKFSWSGDFQRYHAILAIRDDEGWDASPSGAIIRVSESGPNTYEALKKLATADRAGGSMFERATRLKASYSALRSSGELEPPSYDPEIMSREVYLHMAAPATADGVFSFYKELESSGSWISSYKDDPDARMKEIGPLLHMNLETDDDKKRIWGHLTAHGWEMDDMQYAMSVTRAVRWAQKRTRIYEGSLAYEKELLG